VIWGDDIGVHNISAYNHGIISYQTPNLDRIAKEGALFTDVNYTTLKAAEALRKLKDLEGQGTPSN